ncbi:unnamed protein product [Schistocephalus solidus]|uniref:C-type lectin domain-containing protein n=1 Tax=Schistocephalus solidus TaxID=70667 RepID=A0A183SC75_SCHSO|nr:unnamed protein product [Schistocephalus solidus]
MRFLVYGLQSGSAPQWVPQRSLCGFWYMDSRDGSAPQWVPQRSLSGFWYMDSRECSAPQWVPQRSLCGFWYMGSSPQWVPQRSLCGFWYMDSRELRLLSGSPSVLYAVSGIWTPENSRLLSVSPSVLYAVSGIWTPENNGSSVGPQAFSMRFLVYGLQRIMGLAPQWVPQRSLCGFWYMDSRE